MISPREAAARALGDLPAEDPRAVVVGGRDPGLAAGFLHAAPARWVLAPGPSSRMAVAAGAAMCGRPAVALVDAPAGVAEGPWDLGGSLVALTGSLAAAEAAQRGGLRVLQPAWPTDVGSLLHAAIALARPCCLHLHGLALPPRPGGLAAPDPRHPRALATGDRATVVASGRLAPAVAEAARVLAGRGVEVTALELAMLPDRGLTPQEADRGVLIGDGTGREDPRGPPAGDEQLSAWPLRGRGHLRWVEVPSADPRAVVEAVLGTLPAGRGRDERPRG